MSGLNSLLKDYTNDEEVENDDEKNEKINYKEVLELSFKLINAAEKYV